MSNRSTASLTKKALVVLAVGALIAVLVPASAGAHGSTSSSGLRRICPKLSFHSYQTLLWCVTVDGVREHQAAFQAIADANGGIRADQTPGYDASVDYVVERLDAAGWDVEAVPFEYPGFDSALEQLTPLAATYGTGAFNGSGSGDVSGPVTAVDINLDLATGRANTSGCEPEDFDGIDWSGANDIALVQRGACFFSVKAVNAQNAGAEAVVIFNQGDTPAREGLIVANASALPDGSPSNLTIPVIGASYPDGEALSADGSTARAFAQAVTFTSHNVIAELEGRNDDNVVMAGAHLDSVLAGPGIQDNGTGSGALIEVAEQLTRFKPQNTLRFAWWGAEELGLIGSNQWVASRTQEELDEIALYLNYDMIGSPNFIFTIYDADQSQFQAPVPVPPGSEAIEKLLESFYTKKGRAYDDTAFSGRSDYQAFINNGIPAGGLFTGAEVLKTEQQQAIWGGVAGEQFDQCYHVACDTFDNISIDALDVNSDSVAFAVLTYAYSTESVNGVKGKKVPFSRFFPIPEPDGPQGTVTASGGDEEPPSE